MRVSEYRAEIAKSAAFPRRYSGAHLETRAGAYDNDTIISNGQDGVLCFGPYVSLSKGDYVANFELDFEGDTGEVELSITANHGAQVMAHRAIQISSSKRTQVSLRFSLDAELTKNIEFVITALGVRHVRLNNIELDFAPELFKADVDGSLKILHRIYFGFDGKPDQFASYLETWKEQLPGFQIMHWNASNLPMDINDYVKALHKEFDHAFLTDYFRWYVLREYGGVYLDADVEVTNGRLFDILVSELAQSDKFDAFIGIDEKTGGWYTAHSMASKPGSDLSRFMCDIYQNFGSFVAWRKRGMYFWAPQLVALYFASHGHNVDGMGTSSRLTAPEVTARVKIYSQDWFSPVSPTGKLDEPFALDGLSDNTCLCHHFACSWHDDNSIYLAHSKNRGGQTGILLRDLVEQARIKRFGVESPRINTLVGHRIVDKIVTTQSAGFLIFGPRVSMSAGAYRVSFLLSDIEVWGAVIIDMIDGSGEIKILEHEVMLSDIKDGKIVQDIMLDQACEQFEARIIVDGDSVFSFRELVIESTPVNGPITKQPTPPSIKRFDARSPMIQTQVGKRNGDKIITTNQSGFLIYGPMIALAEGHYRVSFSLSDIEAWDEIAIDMTDGNGTVKFV